MKTEIIGIVFYTVILVLVNLFVCHLVLVRRTETVTNDHLDRSIIRQRRSADSEEELPLYRPARPTTQAPRSTMHTREPPAVTTTSSSSNANNDYVQSKYAIELRDTKVVYVSRAEGRSKWSFN